MGPYGIGPFGKSYLLIDWGEAAGDQRWKTARDLLGDVVKFWDNFFMRHPSEGKPDVN